MNDQRAMILLAWAKTLGRPLFILKHRWVLRALVAFNCAALYYPTTLRRFALYISFALATVSTICYLAQEVCYKFALDWYFRPGGQYDQGEAERLAVATHPDMQDAV